MVLCTALKPNGKFSGNFNKEGLSKDREGIEDLYWICDLCCLAIFIYLYSTLHNLQVKNNWKRNNEELFERKLVVYLVLHYSRKKFFRKGFDLEIYFVAYSNLTGLGFLSSCTQ